PPGRTDRRAGRRPASARPGGRSQGPRPRCGGGPHQPQHARGPRGRRPDRGAAAGRASGTVPGQGDHAGAAGRRDDRGPHPGADRVTAHLQETPAVEEVLPVEMAPGRASRWERLATANVLWILLILVGLVV